MPLMGNADWRYIREQLAEYQADPRSQLLGLQELIQRTINGIPTERNTAKGQVVVINEIRPDIELQARRLLRELTNDIHDRAQAQEDRERALTEASAQADPVIVRVELIESKPPSSSPDNT